MFGMGMGELVVVFLIILMLFGANKLPEVAQSLGKSIREFKKAASEIQDNANLNTDKTVKAVEQGATKNQAG